MYYKQSPELISRSTRRSVNLLIRQSLHPKVQSLPNVPGHCRSGLALRDDAGVGGKMGVSLGAEGKKA